MSLLRLIVLLELEWAAAVALSPPPLRSAVTPPRVRQQAAAPADADATTGRFGSSNTRSFATEYARFAEKHYLAVACAQSGLLRFSADGVAQVLRGVPIDVAHCAAMGTMGIVFSGLIGASWLRHLEGRLGGGRSAGDVFKKASCDFFCYAPCANSAYLFFVPLLTLLYSQPADLDLGAATSVALGVLQSGFLAAMAFELNIFAPYNLLSFRLIPPNLRPQTTATACAVYTIALSTLC